MTFLARSSRAIRASRSLASICSLMGVVMGRGR
jgi:hypothetical protein